MGSTRREPEPIEHDWLCEFLWELVEKPQLASGLLAVPAPFARLGYTAWDLKQVLNAMGEAGRLTLVETATLPIADSGYRFDVRVSRRSERCRGGGRSLDGVLDEMLLQLLRGRLNISADPALSDWFHTLAGTLYPLRMQVIGEHFWPVFSPREVLASVARLAEAGAVHVGPSIKYGLASGQRTTEFDLVLDDPQNPQQRLRRVGTTR